jgi:hypothetical protein
MAVFLVPYAFAADTGTDTLVAQSGHGPGSQGNDDWTMAIPSGGPGGAGQQDGSVGPGSGNMTAHGGQGRMGGNGNMTPPDFGNSGNGNQTPGMGPGMPGNGNQTRLCIGNMTAGNMTAHKGPGGMDGSGNMTRPSFGNMTPRDFGNQTFGNASWSDRSGLHGNGTLMQRGPGNQSYVNGTFPGNGMPDGKEGRGPGSSAQPVSGDSSSDLIGWLGALFTSTR